MRTCDYRYLTDESVLVIVYFDSLSRPFLVRIGMDRKVSFVIRSPERN